MKLIPGAKEAIEVSKEILLIFKKASIKNLEKYQQELENYLRMTVYKFGYKEGDENDENYDEIFGSDRPAGGTHDKFKPTPE